MNLPSSIRKHQPIEYKRQLWIKLYEEKASGESDKFISLLYSFLLIGHLLFPWTIGKKRNRKKKSTVFHFPERIARAKVEAAIGISKPVHFFQINKILFHKQAINCASTNEVIQSDEVGRAIVDATTRIYILVVRSFFRRVFFLFNLICWCIRAHLTNLNTFPRVDSGGREPTRKRLSLCFASPSYSKHY